MTQELKLSAGIRRVIWWIWQSDRESTQGKNGDGDFLENRNETDVVMWCNVVCFLPVMCKSNGSRNMYIYEMSPFIWKMIFDGNYFFVFFTFC